MRIVFGRENKKGGKEGGGEAKEVRNGKERKAAGEYALRRFHR